MKVSSALEMQTRSRCKSFTSYSLPSYPTHRRGKPARYRTYMSSQKKNKENKKPRKYQKKINKVIAYPVRSHFYFLLNYSSSPFLPYSFIRYNSNDISRYPNTSQRNPHCIFHLSTRAGGQWPRVDVSS